MMIREKKVEDILFKETLKGVRSDIQLTLILLFFCLFIALLIKFVFKIKISLIVFIIIFVWILFYLSHKYFIQKKKNRKELSVFQYRNTIIDILLLTIVIHYLGGVEWIGAIFYTAILAWTSNVLVKKQSIFLAFIAVCFYTALVLLEYFQILPHKQIFGSLPGFYQNPAFISIQILVLAAVLFFIAENYGTFSEAFKKKQEKLVLAQEEVEDAKAVLEIKVKARTRELKELSENLELQVKERTKKIEEKVEELERFQKLAVGRELKMIELKEQIKKLEKN